MAKLSRRQLSDLDGISRSLQEVLAYVRRDRTVIAVRDTMATTTLHYVRPLDGKILYEIEKEIGSPMAMLSTAVDSLARFREVHGA